MSAWNIKPLGVKDVLTKVGAKADAMSKDLSKQNFDDLSSALSGGAGGLLGEVPAAVNGLLQDQGKNFKTIGDHVQAGIMGVTDATIAYANAQTHMSDESNRYNKAESFQHAMLTAAQHGDMSYFKTHGYDKNGHEVYTPPPPPPSSPRGHGPMID